MIRYLDDKKKNTDNIYASYVRVAIKKQYRRVQQNRNPHKKYFTPLTLNVNILSTCLHTTRGSKLISWMYMTKHKHYLPLLILNTVHITTLNKDVQQFNKPQKVQFLLQEKTQPSRSVWVICPQAFQSSSHKVSQHTWGNRSMKF